jgi:hypothetical protein
MGVGEIYVGEMEMNCLNLHGNLRVGLLNMHNLFSNIFQSTPLFQ